MTPTIPAPKPIHVLELVQTLGLGGLERMVYSLARELNEHTRFKVLVATYDHPEGQPSLIPLFSESSIPLVQWQKGTGFSLRSVIQLVRLMLSEGTRVLHVHDLGPLIYGSLAKLFSWGRVRLVLTLHTLLDIEQNPRYRRYYTFFLRFPDRIIAVSPGIQAGLLTLGIHPKRITVIPNGVTFAAFPHFAGETEGKRTLRKQRMAQISPDLYDKRWLLCLARLHPGKGQDIVLNIWEALPSEVRAGLALFFVGLETDSRYAEQLRQRIRSLKNSSQIVITGPSERPQDWIQCADLFISGSLSEGMPLAPLETAGHGLPTLLSDIEGHRYLESWASYFDPHKPAEGVLKIVDVLGALDHAGETPFFKDRWDAASVLRQNWSVSAMTSSYAETFESI